MSRFGLEDLPWDGALGNCPLQYLSPLGWEHINLTGDYAWRQRRKVEQAKFRPVWPLSSA
ncbi:MAG: hypothetical protein ACREXN_10805 [Polaromonas sp.]